ncbi:ABC transporter ATP-binding protein [Desulfovibrio sp. TomC]|uniref:ABC transporter ATP-binding protein n=1 Tax=Desulfovibrio sp. TomC TaxID=1562888 RepID=UPI000574CA3B|nr:ATP-binding cassette domain-containing protein [Desulfovibrio sp. TomC]KHK01738.1 ABC-type probable sulfate transporter, ATPase component [Desulfovibrio sp. TomC]
MTTAARPPAVGNAGFAVDNLRFVQQGRTLLADLRLRVASGEFVCLYGPAGCGKSVLLRLLAGLEIPSFGSVSFAGRPVAGQDIERGLIVHDSGLFPWLSLTDNLVMAIDAAHPDLPAAHSRKRAKDYLALAGLHEVGDKHPLELSQALRLRGTLARALALDSPVLLLDDPLCVFEASERSELQELLATLFDAALPRRTIILATQDIDEALALADRIIGLGPTAGPAIVDVDVPVPRPRERNTLYDAPQFQALRRRINDSYRQERRQRLAAREFFGFGEGI